MKKVAPFSFSKIYFGTIVVYIIIELKTDLDMANKGMIKERVTILGDKIRYCDFDGVRVYDTNDWTKAIDNSKKHLNSLPVGSSLQSEYILKNLNEKEEAHKDIEKIIECDFDDINWDATPNKIWFEMCDKCIE